MVFWLQKGNWRLADDHCEVQVLRLGTCADVPENLYEEDVEFI